MSETLERRAGRPAKNVLNRDLILATAITVLNRTGPEDFTMAALAKELGVKTPALYHHVGGKNDILAGMRQFVTAGIDYGVFKALPWDEATVIWARSYRAAFAAHPYAISLLATVPVTGAHPTLQMYEEVSQGFRAAGWPEEKIVSAIVALENFILGSALDAVAPPDMMEPGDFAGEVPGYTQALRAGETAEPRLSRADQAFELGLAALVAGLASLK
ncbi:TetR/AcrR family transcriptional regulator [Arthrobacter silvisoli]|uniref:TetR/AcrR family transcriptional regulator n=1 Tax=Arthrobacter silvisoli TaxID=2291022 RepID=UPI000E210316|nr:TetR/AcrR family transcriptional regulator [Arthrobacter silvisoli]